MLRRAAAITAALALPATAVSQPAGRYEATPEVRSYRSINPHHMYWVRGTDTIGAPVQPMYAEKQWWSPHGDGLQVVVRHLGGGVQRETRVDTLHLTRDGRVQSVNGDTARLRGRFDFVPRLPAPARALVAGQEWSDSLGFERKGIVDRYAYIATRTYRVARLLDSLGRGLVELEARGEVRYRDEYWVDSTAGRHVWLDVAGPVDETVLLDRETGLVVRRRWEMDLRGTGAVPDSAGMDTLPAGLRSASDMVLIPDTIADLLMRELPAGDTTLTVRANGVLFRHTVRRSGDTVSSSMLRVDGTLGTVEARYAGARPAEFRALWTDSLLVPRRWTISTRGDSVVVRDSAERVLAIPDSLWAIADYAMGEHLVPLLRSLPADGQARSVAIYRPVPGRWDRHRAVVQRLPDGILALLQDSTGAGVEAYLIVDDGDLLFAEFRGTQRVPQPGTPRRARLDAILARFGGR